MERITVSLISCFFEKPDRLLNIGLLRNASRKLTPCQLALLFNIVKLKSENLSKARLEKLGYHGVRCIALEHGARVSDRNTIAKVGFMNMTLKLLLSIDLDFKFLHISQYITVRASLDL